MYLFMAASKEGKCAQLDHISGSTKERSGLLKANNHPTLWVSVSVFITFFPAEGQFVLLVFTSTLALC